MYNDDKPPSDSVMPLTLKSCEGGSPNHAKISFAKGVRAADPSQGIAEDIGEHRHHGEV
ncbi:hypothetical protein JCM10914A_21630 [Paenibacillus sp. JCM 10914]|nr:hypothetical protein JCM10914_5024 [Paenibacillus sp. JCM 10914]